MKTLVYVLGGLVLLTFVIPRTARAARAGFVTAPCIASGWKALSAVEAATEVSSSDFNSAKPALDRLALTCSKGYDDTHLFLAIESYGLARLTDQVDALGGGHQPFLKNTALCGGAIRRALKTARAPVEIPECIAPTIGPLAHR